MEKITISEYQSDWGKLFIAESEKIKSTLKCSKVYIDHVGSTAVAGLAAKPIIDILISLNNWDDIDEVVEKLTQLGYSEPYRVCRRVNILRDYPDDKIKIYP